MNQFQQSMVRMKIPEGMGPSVSISGFNLEADEKGTIEVPKNLVAVLKDHGLSECPPESKAVAKK